MWAESIIIIAAVAFSVRRRFVHRREARRGKDSRWMRVGGTREGFGNRTVVVGGGRDGAGYSRQEPVDISREQIPVEVRGIGGDNGREMPK